jgi:predicted dehydrogenase
MRVAVVGAGWMGGEHTRAALAAGDEVVAVVDGELERAAKLIAAEGLSGARIHASIEELVASGGSGAITAAVIATPSRLHLQQLALLVAARIPVLVEKPPWIVDQDPGEVIAMAQQNGTFVGVGMTTRFDPGVAALQAAVATGELGDVYWISDEIHFRLDPGSLSPWYFEPASAGGGLLLTNGVHALDRVGWILGAPLELTSSLAFTSGPRTAGGQAAVLHLSRDDDGPPASITISLLWTDFSPPPSRLQVIGSRGAATTDAAGTWHITTAAGSRSGTRPVSHNGYHLQWMAFRNRVMGEGPSTSVLPTLDELRPAMDLVCKAVADGRGRQRFR